MNVISILIHREVSSLRYSSVLYTFCVLLAFFCLAAMFLLSDFMGANEADLRQTFFKWHPWIFAMTAPVLGIRSWSEEGQCGVFEVLGTQPIKMSQLVIAKAISTFIVVGFSLLATLPALVTVMWLGSPDLGAIALGYLASFLCGCAFVAVSQAVCAFMRVSIGAFVAAMGICLVLVTCGINDVANIILATFPELAWLTELLAGISIISKFEPLAEGRLELSAVLGFIGLIAAALLICHRALLVQRGSQRRGQSLTGLWWRRVNFGVPVAATMAMYFVFSTLAANLSGFIDVTEDKRYTLPDAVAESVASLDRPVTVRLFATSTHPKFGFDLARYERRINETMAQLVDKSEGTIKFEILDPNRDAQAARIAAIDEVKQFVYENTDPLMFGLVVESLDQKRVFDSIDPARDRYFLADLVQAVLDVGRNIENAKRICISTPFADRRDSLSAENWTGLNVLVSSYQVGLYGRNCDWADADIMALVHAGELSEYENAMAHQFLAMGGDIIVMADPYSFAAERFADGGALSLRSSNFPLFMKTRGLSLKTNQSLVDVRLQTKRSTGRGAESDLHFLGLGEEQLNQDHPVTAGLDLVHVLYSGAIAIEDKPGFQTTVLATSSDQSLLIDSALYLESAPEALEQELTHVAEQGQTWPVMVLQEPTTNTQGGRLLAVADTDWLYRLIAGSSNASGGVDSHNANVGLAQNMFEYFAGDSALHELRIRSLSKRPLSRWESMRQSIAAPYLAPISQLSSQISKIEQVADRLEQARRAASEDKTTSAEIERQLRAKRQEARRLNADLVRLRGEREAKIQHQLTLIKWINVLSTPLLIALLALWVLWRRSIAVRGQAA